MNESLIRRIGARIKARRRRMGVTQEALATSMSLNHRQILGAIENGERRIQPGELAAAARALEVALDYFTDPYSAAGEAAFSFRAEEASEAVLHEFEEKAGRWLAAYNELQRPSLLKHSLSLTTSDSYERAQEAGDDTRRRLGLGRYPAVDLAAELERQWGILVLNVDAPSGVSGVASRLHGVQAILLNRDQPSGRRNYSLAHEVFHLLTWDSMPPARMDSQRPTRSTKRIEELANNFAAALLMPREVVLECWSEYESLPVIERIGTMAERFGVSGTAVKWRAHNLGLVARSALPEDGQVSGAVGSGTNPGPRPLLFNATFVDRLYGAVEGGRLSLRKATSILGLDSLGFDELCRSYGRQLSYEI